MLFYFKKILKNLVKTIAFLHVYVYNITNLGVKRSSPGLKWSLKEREDMKNNFLGVSKHSLENGNRIIIPSSFREFLAPEFILFKSLDRCLFIYETENFDELLTQLNETTDTLDGRIRARNFTRAAKKCSLDKQGRFTIPADYLEFASLKDVVYLTGAGNRLEIWSEEDYLAQEAAFSPDMYPKIRY